MSPKRTESIRLEIKKNTRQKSQLYSKHKR